MCGEGWISKEESKVQSAQAQERKEGKKDVPSFLLVEFLAHVLAQLSEFSLALGIVGLNHEILEMPKPP
jgi:hypothetical protein